VLTARHLLAVAHREQTSIERQDRRYAQRQTK
jgi:hypothetical protein